MTRTMQFDTADDAIAGINAWMKNQEVDLIGREEEKIK